MRWLWPVLAVVVFGLPAPAQEFRYLAGHGGPVMDLAMGPSGRLASASFDNSVGLWSMDRPMWLEGHAAAVTTLAIAQDGRVYSGGDDFSILAWSDTPREIGRHDGKVTSLAVAPNGDWLASGSWDGTLRLWPLAGGTALELTDPSGGVNDVAFDATGRWLYAATTTGGVLRYDLGTGADPTSGAAPVPLVRHGFGVNELVAGGSWLAYGAVDGGTRVIDAQTGAPIADFTLDRRPILAMAHHPATGQLAVGDGHGYIMLLDTRAWRIDRDARVTRAGPVWALAFAPAGDVLYAGGIDDLIYAWPVAALGDGPPPEGQPRAFLRDPETMPNGERQFVRKCSICHALTPGPSRRAGPTLHALFGRPAGTVPGYRYSDTLTGAPIIWTEETVDDLFEDGPDHYIPGSKMPMQVIAAQRDRDDLIAYLKRATSQE